MVMEHGWDEGMGKGGIIVEHGGMKDTIQFNDCESGICLFPF